MNHARAMSVAILLERGASFTALGLTRDFVLPLWRTLAATIPTVFVRLVDRISARLVLKRH